MTNPFKILLAIGGLIGVAIAWYLLSPLFLDEVVDEAFPEAVPITTPLTPSTLLANEVADPVDTSPPTTVIPVEPVLILSGSFADADENHKGSGSASIYEINGRNVLRFEDFDVTNGPDLQVYLVENAGATTLSGLGQYIDLGALKGNQGNQNYDLPNTFDPELTGGVVIWCEPFQVLFALAVFDK